MIDRFTSDACKDAIIEMSIEDDRLPSFRDFEWKILRLICKILKPLKDATLMAQKRTTSVSSIIPTLKIIEMDLMVADDINEDEDISNVRDENNPFERFLRWNSTEATKESGSRLNEFQSQISAPILDEKIRALSVCLVKFLSSK